MGKYLNIIPLAAVIILGMMSPPASAQPLGEMPADYEGAGLNERLGETVPGDITFLDAAGEPVAIQDVLDRGKPVVLNLVYHSCPMLCNLVLDGLRKSLATLEWRVGEEFEVLTVSFDSEDTPEEAARKKEQTLAAYDRAGAAAGWHFLTGDSVAIGRLTDAVGFEYRWDEATQQYMHTAALVLLSPDATITRYLYGLEFPAQTLRNALVEASDGTVGTTLDRLILYCYIYSAEDNAYVLHAQNLMRVAGGLTVLVLGLTLTLFWRRERDRQHHDVYPEVA